MLALILNMGLTFPEIKSDGDKSKMEILTYDVFIANCRYSFVDSFENGLRINRFNHLEMKRTDSCNLKLYTQDDFISLMLDTTVFNYYTKNKSTGNYLTDIFRFNNSNKPWTAKRRYPYYIHKGFRNKFLFRPYCKYKFNDSISIDATITWFWKDKIVQIKVLNKNQSFSASIILSKYSIGEKDILKQRFDYKWNEIK